jgi:hypothetical protein
VPGLGAERSLPALAVTDSVGPVGHGGSVRPGGFEPVVGLVALVSALANACHRFRLLRAGRPQSPSAQPCSRSYASRMVAGTRPRSLTS